MYAAANGSRGVADTESSTESTLFHRQKGKKRKNVYNTVRKISASSK